MSARLRRLSRPASSIVFSSESGDGFNPGFDVAGEGPGVLVSAFGLEQNRRHAHLAEIGDPIPDATAARIAPNSYQHINFLGRYEFTTTRMPINGELRPLRV